MNLILASSSKYRKVQLQQLGVPFAAKPPLVDEESLKDAESEPTQLCDFLARKKAESLHDSQSTTVVIGADQLVEFEGNVLGKPGTADKALETLLELQGKTHKLITSICVLRGKESYIHRDETELTMGKFDSKFLKSYVAFDQTWDCAGAYKFEQGGQILFERIVTEDFSAIIGLPLKALSGILLELGFNLFSEK